MNLYTNRTIVNESLGAFSAFAGGAPPELLSVADPSSSSESATWTPNWETPYSGSTVNVLGQELPYYLADPSKVDILPDGTPYYLAAPEAGLPSWVLPAAIGAGAFVLLGGLGIFFGVRRKKRRG
jgi:hypothetical protein